MFSEDDLLPISALQHLLFCPRQCALIHIEGLWADNRLTLEGQHLHKNADRGRAQRRGATLTARAMLVRSLKLGLFGKADVVEFSEGVPLPIEYKRGRPKKDGSDSVQLCAQALCLEEMLEIHIAAGAIFYGKTRRRQEVPFDEPLRRRTIDAIGRLREMIVSGKTPVAPREKKCERCSLLSLCMPEVLQGCETASRYLDRSIRAVCNSAGPMSSEDDYGAG